MSCQLASPIRLTATILLFVAWCCQPAVAQRTLRWKFNTGDQLALVMTQEMSQVLKMGEQPEPVTIKNDMTTDMTWIVKGVDEQGQITVTQKIQRVRMKTDVPGAGPISIDTQSDEEPAGIGVQMLKSLSPLIGLEISLVMNDRGKVLDVTVPENAFGQLQANPLASKMFSPKMLEDMTRKFATPLPDEALEVGHEWSTTGEVESPIGKISVKNHFTYDGISHEEGQPPLDKIKLKMEMGFAGGGENAMGVEIDIKDQTSHGHLLFDVDAGRLVSSEVHQEMTMNIVFQNQNIDQKITNVTKMKLSPIVE